MTAVDVDALDAARAAATEGGWRVGLRAGTGTGFYTVDGFPLGSAGLHADAALIVAAVNALEPLLDEVRRGRALREAVEGLAEEWRYKGEFGWGPWQTGEGPDIEGQILDDVALRLRAVVAAVDGGEQR